MTELQILKAVNERSVRPNETIRDIMQELRIPLTLANAQMTFVASSIIGIALYLALPKDE